MTPGTCHVAAEDALNGPLAVACVTTDFAVQNVLLQVRFPPHCHGFRCREGRGEGGTGAERRLSFCPVRTCPFPLLAS